MLHHESSDLWYVKFHSSCQVQVFVLGVAVRLFSRNGGGLFGKMGKSWGKNPPNLTIPIVQVVF